MRSTPPSRSSFAAVQARLAFVDPSTVAFAARTALAGVGVLFVAMWLQLDVPRWAVWTVVIVSPPVHGDVLRKTVSRLIGTAIGCAAGVALVACFPQERIGFAIAFSLWLAACAYWATLRDGYGSYGASLAAFTSAIVAADVSFAPEDVWHVAVDRGSATVLGTLFAFAASEVAVRSDDIPADLARRIRRLAIDLVEWSIGQLSAVRSPGQPVVATVPNVDNVANVISVPSVPSVTSASSAPGAPHALDAPFVTPALQLHESGANAMAERPALVRVKRWIAGLPTALLSLQSAVLALRARGDSEPGRNAGADLHRATVEADADASIAATALHSTATFLRSDEALTIAGLREHARTLAALPDAVDPHVRSIVGALRFLTAALEAILTLAPPARVTELSSDRSGPGARFRSRSAIPAFPPPASVSQPRHAAINFARTVVGMLGAFMIWDLTAWSHGPIFVAYAAVALVLFVRVEDPVAANQPNVFGNLVGGAVGLVVKYTILIRFNDPLMLAGVLLLLLFIGAWMETRRSLAAFALFSMCGLLVVIEPLNPQVYDFAHDVNILLASTLGFAFVTVVFLLIDPPRTGAPRIRALLGRIEAVRARAGRARTRPAHLRYETRMYDEFQRLQAATRDPIARDRGVRIVLAAVESAALRDSPASLRQDPAGRS